MLALLLTTALACGDLCSAGASFWYDDLLRQAGYGRLQRERAAFLIREDDGALTLEPWLPGGDRHATFRGTMPRNAVAVVHTHPRETPSPSPHDRDEARRLGLPVIVVAPQAVTAAMPDGSDRAIR